jgi:hypothetical protein
MKNNVEYKETDIILTILHNNLKYSKKNTNSTGKIQFALFNIPFTLQLTHQIKSFETSRNITASLSEDKLKLDFECNYESVTIYVYI